MSSKIKEQQYFLWQSMIPQLRKNIEQCMKQVKQKPIFISPPEDLQTKINKIKKIFQQNSIFDQQEFLDVIAFFIQEKINITLLQMADMFAITFGNDAAFWTQKITHWANINTFTNSLTIWNVNQFLRNFINYSSSPLQRDFIYQWRHKVQAYLSSLEFLVRKIQRLKKTDSSYAIDDSYFKYHKQKMLYITFVNKLGINNNNDDSKMSYHDDATVTFQNKAKAQKKLFNFPHATKTIDDMSNYTSKHRFLNKKSNNTLEKYNFIKPKYSHQENYSNQNQQKLKIERHRQQFLRNLTTIGKVSTKEINQLRDQLMSVQFDHKNELERQNQRFERSLKQHVIKLTAKKNRAKRQKQKEQTKEQMNEIEMISKQQDNQKELSGFDLKQQKMQNQEMQQMQMQMQIPPLFYQVVEQQSLDQQQFRRFPMSHATFIHNPLDFYSLQGQPIGNRNFPVSNPFALYPWVNYYVNDREEYEEFMAISLEGVSLPSDDDSMQDSGNEFQEGSQKKDDDSYFIDKRAVITPDNVDWENLPEEDKMKFDQIITQDKLRWVASSQSQNSGQFLSRFTCVPVYGTKLPYLMDGSDVIKTKRKGLQSKQKNSQQNGQTSKLGGISVIVQSTQEDDSMTITMAINKIPQLDNQQTSFQQSGVADIELIDNYQLKQNNKKFKNSPFIQQRILTSKQSTTQDLQI